MASDLQIAMYTLGGYPSAPSYFYTDIYAPAPTKPASLDVMFGAESAYPYKILFNQYYDQEKDVWTTPDLAIVSQEIRDAVQNQVNLLRQYEIDYRAWEVEFIVVQDVAWRKKIAQAILSVV